MLYEEAIIPKVVWNFVKKVMKNPVKAGILALLIAGFLKKKEKVEYLERLRILEADSDCPRHENGWKQVTPKQGKNNICMYFKKINNKDRFIFIKKVRSNEYYFYDGTSKIYNKKLDSLDDAYAYITKYMRKN